MLNGEFEGALRDALARSAAEAPIGADVTERLCQRDYRPRTPRRTAAVACLAGAAAAAVTAGAVLLAISGAQPDHGATIHTAGYNVNVPAGFKTHQPAGPASCVDYPIVYRPELSSPEATPVAEPGMSAAAKRLGGAISAEYSAPYTPASNKPDPIDLSPGRQPVRVGRHHGSITPAADIFVPGSAPRAAAAGDTILFVQLPQQGGVYHDLVVGSCHLSKSQLINVVANSLAH